MKIHLNFLYSIIFRIIIFGLLGTISIILIFKGCENISCQKDTEIFAQGKESLAIPFDSTQSLASTINYLNESYCIQGEHRYPALFFDLKNNKLVDESQKGLTIFVEPPPCISDITYNFDDILEIQLDGNNILIEDKRMPLDSVAQFVVYQYLNYGRLEGFSKNPYTSGIWLITEKARPLSDFNEILGEVLRGFMDGYMYLSQSLYGKSICELNEEEWESLSKKMRFRLAFKYSDEEEPIIQIK